MATVTRVALASLGAFPPSTQGGEAQRHHACLLFVVFFFFPREKSNSEAVFQVLSLFCQCQGDLLCHIT